jgi:signal transduction histidine kinase
MKNSQRETSKNMYSTTKSLQNWYSKYPLALFVVILSLLLRWLLIPLIGTGTLYITVYPAIILVSVLIGPGPGVFGMMLSFILVEIFLVGTLEMNWSVLVRFFILLPTSFYAGYISQKLRCAKTRTEADLSAMTTLQKLGTLFLQERNIESILNEIVDASIKMSSADFGNIQLLDPGTKDLKIVAYRGFPAWWIDFWNGVSKGKGSCGTALERGERIIVEDVEKSSLFAGTEALEIQLRAGVRAVQSTPLKSRSGKILGMFSTHYKKPHKPDDRTLRLLDLLARQAADLIEQHRAESALRESENRLKLLNENLENQVTRRTRQVRDLSKELTVAEQRERRRFSLVLHEDLQQALFAGKMLIDTIDCNTGGDLKETMQDVRSVAKSLQKAIVITKSLAVEINPPILKNEGLDSALKWLARHMEERYGLVICIDLAEDLAAVRGVDQILIVQLIREVLFNIVKHAGTKEVVISGVHKEDMISIFVEDKGVGFDSDAMQNSLGGGSEKIGLFSIKERLRLFGGELDIKSEIGKGTRVTITIPLTILESPQS